MNRLICLCKGVREDVISEAIDSADHPNLQLVQEKTGAATNCGRCINAIESLIEKSRSESIIEDHK
ncbi:(2Fe-2S)-binding protein [Carboxylicivirga marina]|uniref:(2Fe-2S)-binding protein n=1 Tax=Carboxylicivirga marina TaxID=2800988 RepID=UPI002594C607|nr:(2Fe-2S)-binding protein [uncultured Carboxylicivirga sp.]